MTGGWKLGRFLGGMNGLVCVVCPGNSGLSFSIPNPGSLKVPIVGSIGMNGLVSLPRLNIVL